MDPRTSFRPYLIPAAILFFTGWAGILILFNFSLPFVWPRWGLYLFWVSALCGTALPLIWFLNLRLSESNLAEPAIVTRHTLWVGFYGAVLLWLQLDGLLTFTIGLWIGIVFSILEYLIGLRQSAGKDGEPS